MYRLAVLNSHPIQYFAPLYRRLANSTDVDVTVFYGSRQGHDEHFVDPGFGRKVVWDVPLLSGYRHEFLTDVGGDRGVDGFFTLVNPAIVGRLARGRFDALLVHGHNYVTHLLGLAAAKLTLTPVFLRCDTHLLLRRSSLKRAIRRPTMRLFYRLANACLYVGTMNREFYRHHGDGPSSGL